ncbi:lysozyme inhibitor LprI family protein [Candidatus Deianiraea vastatrix]|nr:lysozyme inhibitor LprI family protein [Candidatus Deianiraea vastatrix]
MRMFLQSISAIFLCSFFITKHAFAIDCRNVQNDTFASTVCNSNDLINLDKELNDIYRETLKKSGKKDLIDSQREWIKFVYASTCNNNRDLYPSCKKNNAQYNPKRIEGFYKHRIQFLKTYDPSITKFNKIWYTFGGTAHNMIFDGSISCDTHTGGLDTCDTTQSHFDTYTKYNDDCIFEYRKPDFTAYCVIDNSLMVEIHDYKDISETELQNTMYDLYEHAKWYKSHNVGDNKPCPILKSQTFKNLLFIHCFLEKTSYYSRYNDYE